MHRPKGVNRTAQGFSPGNSYPKKNRPERTAAFRALFPTIRTPFQGDIVVGAVPRAEALSLFSGAGRVASPRRPLSMAESRTPNYFASRSFRGSLNTNEALGYSLFALRAIGTDQPGGKLINSAANQNG